MSEIKDILKQHGYAGSSSPGLPSYRMALEILRLRSSEAKLLGVVGKLKDSVVEIANFGPSEEGVLCQKTLASVSAEMKEIEG